MWILCYVVIAYTHGFTLGAKLIGIVSLCLNYKLCIFDDK